MGGVKFAVFTDLHNDVIPDGKDRLDLFLERARREEVDFIIELGDFCNPCKQNEGLLKKFNDFEKPHYHVIGNHDTDKYSKKEIMEWMAMYNTYYSFESSCIKFIVLDTAFIRYGDQYVSYYRRNCEKGDGIYPSIPDQELNWLKSEIEQSSLPIVIFSHHSLENSFGKRGVSNRADVHNIIRQATAEGKKILLCVNGHDHADSIDKIDKTFFFTLNSIAYKWLGPQFEHFCYSDETHLKYPCLKDILLYSTALSAVITIDDHYSIEIQGMKGGYQKIAPEELGITFDHWDGRIISPDVSSVRLNCE